MVQFLIHSHNFSTLERVTNNSKIHGYILHLSDTIPGEYVDYIEEWIRYKFFCEDINFNLELLNFIQINTIRRKSNSPNKVGFTKVRDFANLNNLNFTEFYVTSDSSSFRKAVTFDELRKNPKKYSLVFVIDDESVSAKPINEILYDQTPNNSDKSCRYANSLYLKSDGKISISRNDCIVTLTFDNTRKHFVINHRELDVFSCVVEQLVDPSFSFESTDCILDRLSKCPCVVPAGCVDSLTCYFTDISIYRDKAIASTFRIRDGKLIYNFQRLLGVTDF